MSLNHHPNHNHFHSRMMDSKFFGNYPITLPRLRGKTIASLRSLLICSRLANCHDFYFSEVFSLPFSMMCSNIMVKRRESFSHKTYSFFLSFCYINNYTAVSIFFMWSLIYQNIILFYFCKTLDWEDVPSFFTGHGPLSPHCPQLNSLVSCSVTPLSSLTPFKSLRLLSFLMFYCSSMN